MKAKGDCYRAAVVLLVIACVLFVGARQAAATEPDYYRCVGSSCLVWGSCSDGCGPIWFRVRKAAVVKQGPTTENPWTFTWLEAWGTGDFVVECSCDEGENWETAATYKICKITLYVNSGCTTELTDWEAGDNNLRSPKFCFGKEESIYIKVEGPSGLGDSFFEVQVTSESDTTGVPIVLDDEGSGVYKNTSTSGELLRLSTASSQAAYDYIKVVDEEVLTFKLKVKSSGAEICTLDVMVDRGEFATITARSYDSRPNINNAPDRTPLWNDAADEFKNDINDSGEGNLDWWGVGEVRGSDAGNNDAFDDFLKNGGSNQANNLESDMFYTHSHGNNTGDLYGTEITSAGPPIIEDWETIFDCSNDFAAGDWNNDVEWPIIKACSVLQHDGTGRAHYEDALEHAPRRAPPAASSRFCRATGFRARW